MKMYPVKQTRTAVLPQFASEALAKFCLVHPLHSVMALANAQMESALIKHQKVDQLIIK